MPQKASQRLRAQHRRPIQPVLVFVLGEDTGAIPKRALVVLGFVGESRQPDNDAAAFGPAIVVTCVARDQIVLQPLGDWYARAALRTRDGARGLRALGVVAREILRRCRVPVITIGRLVVLIGGTVRRGGGTRWRRRAIAGRRRAPCATTGSPSRSASDGARLHRRRT